MPFADAFGFSGCAVETVSVLLDVAIKLRAQRQVAVARGPTAQQVCREVGGSACFTN